MLTTFFNIGLSAGMIAFTTWLAGRKPALAGFILSLPVSSLIALALAQAEYRDTARTAMFAKGIFVGVPVSLLFFVPFLFADRFKPPFWVMYGSGIALLAAGYGIHRMIFRS